VSANEVDALLKSFTDPSGIRANGLHLGGVKYFALKCDERSVYGKKVGCGGGEGGWSLIALQANFCSCIIEEFEKAVTSKPADLIDGASGVICVKTNKAVLIGIYNEKTQPGEAAQVVEVLADYLISLDYVSHLRSCPPPPPPPPPAPPPPPGVAYCGSVGRGGVGRAGMRAHF
ncbi:MAG: profilin, partial [Olpidium bornovanus]